MRTALVLLIAVGTLAAAPVPKDLKQPDDKTLLVGTWNVTALSMNGKQNQTAHIHTHTFGFAADGKCHTLFGQEPSRSDWTFTLDPKATPKRMKWSNVNGSAAFDCVYEVSGDKLKVGFVAKDQPAPDKVEPCPGLTLYEMTRVKDAK